MPTMKRRIVYLADEDWDQLQRRAAVESASISAVIRRLVGTLPGPDRDLTVRMVATGVGQAFKPVPPAKEAGWVEKADIEKAAPGRFGTSKAAPKK